MSSKTRVIHDALIFYSDHSGACEKVRRYVERADVPVSMISVDTAAMRKALTNMKNVRIRAVPTLVVVYKSSEESGSLTEAEVFEGDKVMSWLFSKFGTKEVERPERIRDSKPVRAPKPKVYEDSPYDPPEPHDPPVQKPVEKRKRLDTIKELAKEMEEQRRRALNVDEHGTTVRSSKGTSKGSSKSASKPIEELEEFETNLEEFEESEV